MASLSVLPRAHAGAALLVSFAALAWAGAAMPASAQVLDLASLTTKTSALDTAVGLLRTDTTAAANALTVQAGLLTGLRTDLGGLGTDVASLKVQVGDLRGLLDGLPDLGDGDGPLGLPAILETLNSQVLENAGNLSKVNVTVNNIQNNDARQDGRLDDHERRITQTATVVNANQIQLADHERRISTNTEDIRRQDGRLDDHERRVSANTDDIRRHDLAIGDLQSRMADGFADVGREFHRQGKRIDKATEGVAMAIAMKSPAVPEDKNFALSGSFGAFEGQTAVALAGGVRATDALQFDAGLAIGLEEGSVGGRAGATFAW